jgi:hypothetical protein
VEHEEEVGKESKRVLWLISNQKGTSESVSSLFIAFTEG